MLDVKPQPIAARIRIPFTFTADFPLTGQQTFAEQIELIIGESAPPSMPPWAVWQAARLLNLFRLNEQAWNAAAAGELESAVSGMRHLATRLLELGESALAEQADREASRLALTGELSAEHRKQLKYGTRALTRKSCRWSPMIICKTCGQAALPGTLFCAECGAPLQDHFGEIAIESGLPWEIVHVLVPGASSSGDWC